MKAFMCNDVDDKGYAIPNSGCGIVDYVIFDGYSFGNHLLEDVEFKAFIRNDKICVDTVDE